MGITYEVIEGPYPYVCALYRCRCGASVIRHGADAGSPPSGWDEDAKGETCSCPECVARAAARDGGADTLPT